MPFLKHVARKKKPIILSTGMSTLGEVEEALNWIYEESNYDVTLLHCTSNYPANVANVNLKAMLTMKNAFNVKVGYSDHTQGIEIPIAAVALGAEVIEKHFTVDKNFVGPDHKASLEPNELKLLVQSIRNVELAMGDGIKKPTPSEKDTAEVARKSIVSKVDIPAGTKITENMVCVKRPGIGIQPKYIDFVIGRKAIRNIKADELIEFKDIS
jgi:sialic acid synthase SpsE